MNEDRLKRKLEFQRKVITKQSEQIDLLKSQIEKLELQVKEKDEIINSVASLKSELTETVKDTKKYKEEYKELVEELRKMKEIMNQEIYKGRWKLVRFLIK